MTDFSPSLNNVKVESPTEDGKIAFIMNTMVPRRLEQFDDIERDLANPNFNIDRTYFYVNFQAGDFCGRSYKLPLSELDEFVAKALLVGVNGKEPLLHFDCNFDSEGIKKGRITLLVDSTDPEDTNSLVDVISNLQARDEELQTAIDEERSERIEADDKLDNKKNDKFVIVGSGDKQDPTSHLPIPKADSEGDPYGVHVTYDPPGYTGLDLGDGTTGPVILIDHDFKLPWDVTCAYNIGGLAKDQFLEKGTPVEEII